MDRYIKVSDLMELIEKEEEEIKKEFEENKMSKSQRLVSIGTLEVLKSKILEGAE